MLLTGKHAGHARIRGNDEWAERGDVWNYGKAVNDANLEGQRPILNTTITLGKVMQNAGYKTAVVGKWGLGAPNTEGIPTKIRPLIEDGVYAALANSDLSAQILAVMDKHTFYVLGPDLLARGIQNSVLEQIESVDYSGFVTLCTQYDKVVSWY